MPYLHCGRCGLQIKIQTDSRLAKNCPRCLAHTKALTPLVLSANRIVAAGGFGSDRRPRLRPRA